MKINTTAIAQTLYVELIKDSTVTSDMRLTLNALFNHYLEKVKRFGASAWDQLTSGQRIKIGQEFSKLVARYEDARGTRIQYVRSSANNPMRYSVRAA